MSDKKFLDDVDPSIFNLICDCGEEVVPKYFNKHINSSKHMDYIYSELTKIIQ